MSKFKYNNIKDLVNSIKNNTISEIQAKKDLNALKKTKKAKIKSKHLILRQKELSNLFDDLLEAIPDNNSNSNNNSNNGNVNNNHNNENGNENENEIENENENENKNAIKELNHHFDEIIDKTKSFEKQVKLLGKVETLK